MEERIAIGLVRVPAVFAVEGDHRQEGRVLLPLLDGAEAVDEVRGRLVGRRILVLEANRVGERRVAEHEMDRRAVALKTVGRVELLGLGHLSLRVPADRTLKRPGEDPLIAEHPLQPVIGGQPHHVLGNGGLRRPEAARPAPEVAPMRLQAQAQLLSRVVRVREYRVRHLQVRPCDARDAKILDQGQDGVVVRAGDQLGLPSLLQLPIFGKYRAEQFELHPQDGLHVRLRKQPAFQNQLGNLRIALDRLGADPRQVEPHEQITQLGVGEQRGQAAGRGWARLLPLAHQFQVAWILAHAPNLARLGHPARDEGPLVGAEPRHRTAGQVHVDVCNAAVDIVLDLLHQRRHQVERLLEVGVRVEQRRHLVIVLGGAQPNPGQQKTVAQVVFVIRLVHVPDEGHMQRARHGERV